METQAAPAKELMNAKMAITSKSFQFNLTRLAKENAADADHKLKQVYLFQIMLQEPFVVMHPLMLESELTHHHQLPHQLFPHRMQRTPNSESAPIPSTLTL
jgi:hypothetical protein